MPASIAPQLAGRSGTIAVHGTIERRRGGAVAVLARRIAVWADAG